MAKNKLAYLELPTQHVPELKEFYGCLFGWKFEDFGDDYAAFSEAGLDGGFNAVTEDKAAAPLAIVETDAIDKWRRRYGRLAGRSRELSFRIRADGASIFLIPAGTSLV